MILPLCIPFVSSFGVYQMLFWDNRSMNRKIKFVLVIMLVAGYLWFFTVGVLSFFIGINSITLILTLFTYPAAVFLVFLEYQML